jgi:hypothetical protein
VVVLNPSRVVWAHNVEGAAETKVGLMDETPAVVSAVSPVTIAEAATNCLGLVIGNLSTIFVVYHNATQGLRCSVRNNGLAELVAPTTVDNTTSPVIVNVTGYKLRDNTGVRFFYQVYAAATYNHFVKTNTFTTAGVAGTASVFLRGVGLASKAFTYYPEGDDEERLANINGDVWLCSYE